MVRRIMLVLLALLVSASGVVGPAVAWADDCACSSLSPPEGYYVTSISPVWVKGRSFLATGSMVTISEAHLVSLDVLLQLTSILEKSKDHSVKVADVLAGNYLVARLSLYASKGSLAADQLSFFLETSECKAIFPVARIEWPANLSYLSLYLLVDKAQVLDASPSWVRMHVAGPQGQGYFQLRG
ncbi:MAG: hypothetical protein ACOX4G_02940 [Limnochordia bacterium]|jgi:hypothetical protein